VSVSFSQPVSQRLFRRCSFAGCLLRSLLLFTLLFTLLGSGAWAEEPPVVEIAPEVLWGQAVAARDAERSMAAAVYFQRYQDRFPNAEHAEEAIWEAAQQAKKHALTAKDPNWRYVRDLFKRYTIDYPASPRYQEAYYEGAIAHFNMRMFREALIYFNLFLKRFPASPLVPQARYWRGQTFLEIGRLAEATAVFEELSKVDDPTMRLRGFVGLGDALYAGEQYLAALAAYKNVVAMRPEYHFDDPSLLVKLGKAYFKVGNEIQGRNQLFHYLNLDKGSNRRPEVFFEIGESYHRQGDEDAAQRLYDMVLDEGTADSRAVVLSRFRKAQHLDDPDLVIPDWKKPTDLTNPSGDKPYMDVLDRFYRDPVAQEARLALIRRYQARKDNRRLFEVAANFIQHAPDGPLRQEMEALVGDLLVERVQEHLAAKRYQDVYDLYRAEYRHVTAYRQGRLLYYIGQAFEELTLYDQAAVIYYRALALPLTDAERADLYYRRARVYLAKKDWIAADRLLTHLRKVYKDDKALGEFVYQSGLLEEARGNEAGAATFYLEAVARLADPEQKPLYAPAALKMLIRLGRNAEAQALLARFAREEWLAPDGLQEWHGRLADNLLKAGDYGGAAKVYAAGLANGMPQEGELVQAMQVRQGTAFALAGKFKEARASLEAASGGKNEMWRRVAMERLNQLKIDSTMLKVEPVLGR